MRNVQTHEALPARITYSSTHTHTTQLGYGVGVVYIPSPQPLIFFFPPFFWWWWGGASSVSGKGNKGPLCPVGVGPPFPWTPISPLTGTWRVRLKVGGGGPGVTGVWLIMWWPGEGCVPYVLNNENALMFSPEAGVWRRRMRPRHAITCCPRSLEYNTAWDSEGHADVLSRHPEPAPLQYAGVMSEWTRAAWFPLPRHSLYIHAERPMSYSQHTCLEFPSRNPASRPSEINDPSSTRTTAHLSAFQERKPENLFQTRGHICIPDNPPTIAKNGSFFFAGGAPRLLHDPEFWRQEAESIETAPNSICTIVSIYRCVFAIKNIARSQKYQTQSSKYADKIRKGRVESNEKNLQQKLLTQWHLCVHLILKHAAKELKKIHLTLFKTRHERIDVIFKNTRFNYKNCQHVLTKPTDTGCAQWQILFWSFPLYLHDSSG